MDEDVTYAGFWVRVGATLIDAPGASIRRASGSATTRCASSTSQKRPTCPSGTTPFPHHDKSGIYSCADPKRQSPVARSCQHRSRTKGPFLHRHYPASPVLRPYPPPQGAGSVPHDTTVGQHRLPATPRGFPCCTQPLFRTCRRHYPGGTVGCLRRSPSPTAAAFPEMKAGRLPHCLFRGLLSVHCTLRPIRSLNPLRTLLHRNASAASLPPRPFRLLPAGTTLAGWDSHPLRLCTFARRTSLPQATRAGAPAQASFL